MQMGRTREEALQQLVLWQQQGTCGIGPTACPWPSCLLLPPPAGTELTAALDMLPGALAASIPQPPGAAPTSLLLQPEPGVTVLPAAEKLHSNG